MQPHIRLNTSMTRAKYALLPGDPGGWIESPVFLIRLRFWGKTGSFARRAVGTVGLK